MQTKVTMSVTTTNGDVGDDVGDDVDEDDDDDVDFVHDDDESDLIYSSSCMCAGIALLDNKNYAGITVNTKKNGLVTHWHCHCVAPYKL